MNGNAIAIIMGFIMIAIAFTMFPMVLDGADAVRTAGNVTQYTGLSSTVAVAPTLIFVVFLFTGAASMIGGGYNMYRRRSAR